MEASFQIQFLPKKGCLLRTSTTERKFSTTLEALEFARTQPDARRTRVEIIDETGRRFMVVKL